MPTTSSVRDFLLGDEWHGRFDDFVLNDGAKLARKRRVKELSWSALEDGGGTLAAQVEDLEGDVYETEISIWHWPTVLPTESPFFETTLLMGRFDCE